MVHTGQVNILKHKPSINTESLSCTHLPRATATHLCGFLPTTQNKTMSYSWHNWPHSTCSILLPIQLPNCFQFFNKRKRKPRLTWYNTALIAWADNKTTWLNRIPHQSTSKFNIHLTQKLSYVLYAEKSFLNIINFHSELFQYVILLQKIQTKWYLWGFKFLLQNNRTKWFQTDSCYPQALCTFNRFNPTSLIFSLHFTISYTTFH